MSKDLFFEDDARSKLKKGVDALANAVKTTLGPEGRNVLLERQYGAPHVTKDGVSVAKEIELKDPVENMGAQLVKEVASKTADMAGDGTTTATVLAQAIFGAGIKSVSSGANAIDIKRGIDLAVKSVVENLKSQSKAVKDNSEIEQVATISANSDKEIGKLIAEAMAKVGNDGVITVEQSKTSETRLEVVDGMEFDKGLISPYFINNENMTAEFEEPYILITDSKVSNLQALVGVLEAVASSGKPLLIIAEDVDGQALNALIMNKVKNNLPFAAVKAPAFGERRKEILKDIATLTGGTFISEEIGIKLDQADISMLGVAEKITISKNTTTIVGGKGSEKDISDRVATIKSQIETTTSDYDKDKLKERLAKITGGIAVIHIGAATEVEMKEKKDRVDDALHATKAAVEEGIVAGGGTAFIRALEILDKLEGENDDQNLGINIIKSAITSPLRTIVENTGSDEGIVIIQKVKEGKGGFGYNAKTHIFEDLIAAGVVDPTKVTRLALENSASIASLLLTTECTVSENREDLENQPPMGGGMPMGGMM